MQKMQKDVNQFVINNNKIITAFIKKIYLNFLNLKSFKKVFSINKIQSNLIKHKNIKFKLFKSKSLLFKKLNYIFILYNLNFYKIRSYLSKVRQLPLYKTPLVLESFVDFDKLLKNVSLTFHTIKTNLLINNTCFISFKFSRTNRFFSLLNVKGEVINSYSCGIFKNVKRLKHKRNFFLVKVMISFIVYKLKQCNFQRIFLKTRLSRMSSITILKILTSLLIKRLRLFYKKKTNLFFRVYYFYFLKKLIVRNGIRTRKPKRR